MRGWLAVLALLCSQALWAAPQRVVALSWDAAEQVLALGVVPLAVADRADYQRWVGRPSLPASVQDVGSRTEPNLELLAQLKPDLILIDAGLADMQARLARIAPVRLLPAFSRQHDNAAMARMLYWQLAQWLGRTAYARQHLQAMDRRLAQLRQQLQHRYPQGGPAVCVLRIGSPSVVWLYGANSMPQAALQALGLRSACPVAAGDWGVAQRRVGDLAALAPGSTVLALAPLEPAGGLWRSPLWQAMPFVRQGHFAAMRSTWSYGGVTSIQYLAEAIVESLQSLPSKHTGLPHDDRPAR